MNRMSAKTAIRLDIISTILIIAAVIIRAARWYGRRKPGISVAQAPISDSQVG